MVQPPVAGLPIDTFKQPIKHFLVHYDYDGNFVSKSPFVDDGALVVMGLDGRMYATTLSVTTSIAHYGANPNMPFFHAQHAQALRQLGGLTTQCRSSTTSRSWLAWHGALLRDRRAGARPSRVPRRAAPQLGGGAGCGGGAAGRIR